MQLKAVRKKITKKHFSDSVFFANLATHLQRKNTTTWTTLYVKYGIIVYNLSRIV